MYECPNCAGNLKFDIVRQQMYCEYCGTQADPYTIYKEKDAEETGADSGEYEVTVFTCPQCGGEIISEDTTAATFCSFCGGSVILDSRIGKERRPAYIIPFAKTKEDCRAAYGKMLRRAVFAPKEFKDEALVEKFRGIYMPYWVFSFEKKESVTFPGKKTRRRGDYLITDHYTLECRVEEDYRGLAYDASSTFSDSLSSAIAPFDLRAGKKFVPAFLSGFYADTSDVGKYVYLQDAEELVIEDACRQLSRDRMCRAHQVEEGGLKHTFRNALRPSDRSSELAMLPVWFLSYRNGDRVSYAVVNGQTGKAAADLPVDGKRYLAGSFLLAVPLFFFLNLFLTITPGRLLAAAVFLAILCLFISNRQLSQIFARESGEDDKGLASVQPASGAGNPGWQKRRRIRMPWDGGTGAMGKILLMMLLFYATAMLPGFFLSMADRMTGGGSDRSRRAVQLVVGVLLFAGISLVFSSLNRQSGRSVLGKRLFPGGNWKEKLPVLAKPLCGIVAALIILVVNPVFDWIYYMGVFACMGTVLWAILDIIRQHNKLTTRKLPQLNRRGGDEVG